VLHSRTVPGIEQEIFALLTAHQALIRAAGDLTIASEGMSTPHASLTVPRSHRKSLPSQHCQQFRQRLGSQASRLEEL
jgi:hypothetical protein